MTSKRLVPYKWELIALLWFAFFLNQGDRQIYSVVLPLIKADLHLTDVQAGLIVTCFFLSYAILVPVAGYVGDVFRRKWVVLASLLTFSGATLLTGLSTGMASLILLRSVATGGGEALYAPAANSLIGQFHQTTRGLAMSIHQTASYAGIITTGFLAAYIGECFGWQSSFLCFGIMGILLAAIMFFRFRGRDASPQQPRSVDAGGSSQRIPIRLAVGAVFGKPTALMLSLAFGGMVFVNIGFTTWAPTFLHEKFDLSLTSAGFAAMFYHHAFAFVGVLLGGRLSDAWRQRRLQARMEVEYLGLLLGAPFICLVGLSDSLTLCCIALAGFGLFRGIYDSNIFAALFDVIEPRFRASSIGIMVSFALIIGAPAPLILGWVKETMGLSLGISSLSVVYLLSAATVFLASKTFFPNDRLKDLK